MFSTPSYFVNSEIAYRRERISKGIRRRPRRHNVRRRHTRHDRPGNRPIVAGGTAVLT